MFGRRTCDCCGRRFFGDGRALRRFDNTAIVICSDKCASVEKLRRDEAYAAFLAKGRAERAIWADGVRRSIAAGGWQRISMHETAPGDVARLGGVPLGIGEREWPIVDGVPALHVCTLPGPPLGLSVAGLAVFLHVERGGNGALLPLPACSVVTIATTNPTGYVPPHVLRPRALSLEPAPPGWDPTECDAPRSFAGTIAISFEGESMESRWPEPVVDHGRFLAQLTGEELPWTELDTCGELAGLYVFERAAIPDFYG